MGRDKAWLELAGVPLVECVLAAVKPVVDRLMIVSERSHAQSERLENLATRWNARLLFDLHPGNGPLGGIQTSLCQCERSESALILACDLPFLTSEFLAFLRHRHELDGKTITVPLDAHGQVQPLTAVYSSDCLEEVVKQLDKGKRRIDLLYECVPTSIVAFDAFAHLDGAKRLFTNLNTPEDFQSLIGA